MPSSGIPTQRDKTGKLGNSAKQQAQIRNIPCHVMQSSFIKLTDVTSGRRTYNIYITYSNAWRTPRLYLAGYNPDGTPLPPRAMMEDIMGDYKDKTVTLEDFPYYDGVKMASVHPCKHAPVMKTLMDRADAALEIQREKRRAGKAASGDLPSGMQGLVDELGRLDVKGAAREDKDEWEEVHEAEANAILVDHYLVVFIKVNEKYRP